MNTGRRSRGCRKLTAWASGSRQAGKIRWEPRSGRMRGFSADLAAQVVGPGAGGVDHHPGADFGAFTAFQVVQHGAIHLPIRAQQAFGTHIIDGAGIPLRFGARFLQHAQRQAGVVGLGIAVAEATLQVSAGQRAGRASRNPAGE